MPGCLTGSRIVYDVIDQPLDVLFDLFFAREWIQPVQPKLFRMLRL